MSDKKDVFDVKALEQLLAPHYESVRAKLFEAGAMEAVVNVLSMAFMFKATLARLGVTPEEMERAEKASTGAEAAQILRAAILKEKS